MDKQHILAEIKRTAKDHGGSPLGTSRFQTATGIKRADWYGKYWVRWGDAIKEAGFQPNELQGSYDEEFLLGKLCEFIRELGHYPVSGELRLKAHQDKSFPDLTTFARLGNKGSLIQKAITYCESRNWKDIITLCTAAVLPSDTPEAPTASTPVKELGFVYLIKYGRHYKIGRTNAAGRREREIALQLPEKTNMVHAIRTDDPAGIEEYWHRRFQEQRTNGEWFALTPADIAAFRRRKFM